MNDSGFDFSAFAPVRRDSRPSQLDLCVEKARHALGAALRDALARGVVSPAAFIATVDSFAGLAFARELHRDDGAAGASIVGCEARNVVACALLAVDNDACRALLEMTYDAEHEVPLLILDSRVRVATISREDLTDPPARNGG
jgi:hypothetical protein